jgi:hypothetical protein
MPGILTWSIYAFLGEARAVAVSTTQQAVAVVGLVVILRAVSRQQLAVKQLQSALAGRVKQDTAAQQETAQVLVLLASLHLLGVAMVARMQTQPRQVGQVVAGAVKFTAILAVALVFLDKVILAATANRGGRLTQWAAAVVLTALEGRR